MSAPARDEHTWGDAPELYGPRHEFRESLLVDALARLGPLPGGDAVDAGAGAGSMALRLARHGFRVTAVDGSDAFVARLGRMLDAAPGGPHRALTGDMHRLALPAACADVVVCAEVLEHLDDDVAAAAELARVMRPGAVLVVSVPAGPRRYDWTDKWAGHRRRYTQQGLTDLLQGAGLDDVRVTAWGFPVTGFYHRHVYRPMLARRLDRAGESTAGDAMGPPRPAVARVLRAAFAVDRLFLGRKPGYMGFIATARRPGP